VDQLPSTGEPLAIKDTSTIVTYRIAYITFCVENSPLAGTLLEELKGIAAIDSEYDQFCCAEWFWKRQVNSYILQVEPERFKHKDTALILFGEALYVEQIRNEFFVRLNDLHEKLSKRI